MKTNKILIVGGHGYIGRELAARLALEFEIRVPTRQQLEMGRPASYSYLKGNQFDLVVILAASISGLNPSQEVSEALLSNNVQALDSFLSELPVGQRILYSSSMAVYGDYQGEVSEDMLPRPYNPYGKSKQLAEEAVVEQSVARNFHSAIIRIPGVYGGDRQSGLLYQLKQRALRGEMITINTTGLLNWETIELHDLCAQLVDFIKHYPWNFCHAVFNLGYGHVTDLIETAQKVIRFTNSDSPLVVAERSYRPFYQSTRKVAPFLVSTVNFDDSLKRYLGVGR